MPASRRARAITFAPRSCPSNPGLATNTRILASSAIAQFNHRRRANAEVRIQKAELNSRKQPRLYFCILTSDFLLLTFLRLHVQTPPKIPASHAAIRRPAFRDFLHLFRLQRLELPPLGPVFRLA